MATAVSARSERTPGNTYFKPMRLEGALAADENIVASGSAKERINVAGATSILVAARNKTTHQGTMTLSLHRMAAPATSDDTDGADRLTTGLPTPVTFTAVDQDREIEMALKGEEYVEIEFTLSGTGGDNGTIDFVDVYLQR